MRVAIASGKGGTGKTTVAASLVSIWYKKLAAVDMDVEEPNLHLFLKPLITKTFTATLKIPKVDASRCNGCGICSEFCQFSAINLVGQKVLVFPEMCHGCGGCMVLCPEGAIYDAKRDLGNISWGKTGNNNFLMGELRVGEAMSPPLMREINKRLDRLDQQGDIIIDSPPGTSCPAINTVAGSDIILLVTEPTPFGIYDLKLAYESFSQLEIPMAVIVNRFGLGSSDVFHFCETQNLPIISKIPYKREIASSYSRGEIIINNNEIKKIFLNLSNKIRLFVKKNRIKKSERTSRNKR